MPNVLTEIADALEAAVPSPHELEGDDSGSIVHELAGASSYISLAPS